MTTSAQASPSSPGVTGRFSASGDPAQPLACHRPARPGDQSSGRPASSATESTCSRAAANGTLCVGITSDLVRRVTEHRERVVPGFTEKYGVTGLVWAAQDVDQPILDRLRDPRLDRGRDPAREARGEVAARMDAEGPEGIREGGPVDGGEDRPDGLPCLLGSELWCERGEPLAQSLQVIRVGRALDGREDGGDRFDRPSSMPSSALA
jgi:hypothetical protein